MTRERKPLRDGDERWRIGKEWVKSDWFCMECGKQDVWQGTSQGGDYYHDYNATCHSCGHEMCCLPPLLEDLK